MSKPTDIERVTQNRVVKLFEDELNYTYLGDWEEREGNSNIEEEYLYSSNILLYSLNSSLVK